MPLQCLSLKDDYNKTHSFCSKQKLNVLLEYNGKVYVLIEYNMVRIYIPNKCTVGTGQTIVC